MIKVFYNEGAGIELHFKYNIDYINRLHGISSAYYDKERKVWFIALEDLDTLEQVFHGELMYMTPKWVIDGSPAPDYNVIYSQVPCLTTSINPPYKPYSFQLFGANFLTYFAKKYKFACLLDDMGTGKTLMAIYASLLLDQSDDLMSHELPILVVCKSGLKRQWVNDGILKFTNGTSLVIDGTKAKRKKQYQSLRTMTYDYVIVGYETIREDIDILETFDIGLCIFDEAHKIRNHETHVNKACSRLNKAFSFFLTGSPVSSDPSEIYGIGAVGNPEYFGNWTQFRKKYINTVRTKFGFDRFYKNLDDLMGKINGISLRRTEKEINLEMPDIISQDIHLTKTVTQEKIDTMLDSEMTELSEKISSAAASKIPEEQQKAEKYRASLKGLFTLKVGNADTPELFAMSHSPGIIKKYGSMSDNKSPKLDYLKEQVSEILESGNKVVVFTKFETMARIIARELGKMKINTCLFTGKMSSDEKEASRLRFKTDSSYNVFIATNAGAEG